MGNAFRFSLLQDKAKVLYVLITQETYIMHLILEGDKITKNWIRSDVKNKVVEKTEDVY